MWILRLSYFRRKISTDSAFLDGWFRQFKSHWNQRVQEKRKLELMNFYILDVSRKSFLRLLPMMWMCPFTWFGKVPLDTESCLSWIWVRLVVIANPILLVQHLCASVSKIKTDRSNPLIMIIFVDGTYSDASFSPFISNLSTSTLKEQYMCSQ
jgi:hypothetical protein